MRAALIFLTVFFIPFSSSGQGNDSVHVKNRYILLFSPDVNNAKYQQELLLLAKDPLGLDRRNILILEIFPEGGLEADGTSMEEERAQKLRTDYGVNNDEFLLILVDADQRVKLRKNDTAGCTELFRLLD